MLPCWLIFGLNKTFDSQKTKPERKRRTSVVHPVPQGPTATTPALKTCSGKYVRWLNICMVPRSLSLSYSWNAIVWANLYFLLFAPVASWSYLPFVAFVTAAVSRENTLGAAGWALPASSSVMQFKLLIMLVYLSLGLQLAGICLRA